jgi:hypothetical protein
LAEPQIDACRILLRVGDRTQAPSSGNGDPTATHAFECEKWEAERTFREREISIKEREQAIKEAELTLKKEEHAISQWRNPLVVAIFAAAVAASGNAVVAFTNGAFQRQLESQKSEQARILEMIKTGDADKAAENLRFLLDAGLRASEAPCSDQA